MRQQFSVSFCYGPGYVLLISCYGLRLIFKLVVLHFKMSWVYLISCDGRLLHIPRFGLEDYSPCSNLTSARGMSHSNLSLSRLLRALCNLDCSFYFELTDSSFLMRDRVFDSLRHHCLTSALQTKNLTEKVFFYD